MSIAVICPCGKRLKVKNEFAGKQVTCPACRHAVTVPEGDDGTGSGPAIDAQNRQQQGVRTHRKRARKPVLVGSLVLVALAAALVAGYFLFLRNRSNKPNETDPSSAQQADIILAGPTGCLDVANFRQITGWAWDPMQPDKPLDVNLFDNDNLLITVPADQFRQDLFDQKKGNGKHRFMYPMPPKLMDGKEHVIRAKIAGTNIELRDSPKRATLKPRQ